MTCVDAGVFMSCQHVIFCFCSYTVLTGNLLHKQPSDCEEVIEKLFSEVSGLEDCPKTPDPQVSTENSTMAHSPGQEYTVKANKNNIC